VKFDELQLNIDCDYAEWLSL